MNEVSVIASETHEKAIAYFKVAEQYGYKFIMEVKQIRDRQYYKAIGFDSFESYCEQAWNAKRGFMDERIQIADSIGSEWDFNRTYGQLGHSKSLILAKMDPEYRQEVMTQPQHLPNGEIKAVDEMTVRQLKQLEKEWQEANERADQMEEEKRKLEQQLKNVIPLDQLDEVVAFRLEEYQEQVVIEKQQIIKEKDRQIKELESRKPETKEVIPQKMKDEVEDLKASVRRLRTEREELEHKHKHLSDLEYKEQKLRIEGRTSIYEMQIKIKKFIEDAAPSIFLQGAVATNPIMKKDIEESVIALEEFCVRLRDVLNSKLQIVEA